MRILVVSLLVGCTYTPASFPSFTFTPTPLFGRLYACPSVTGPHVITVELHHADGSPVVDPRSGATVSDSVSITVE